MELLTERVLGVVGVSGVSEFEGTFMQFVWFMGMVVYCIEDGLFAFGIWVKHVLQF
jgi:hypothetical protein